MKTVKDRREAVFFCRGGARTRREIAGRANWSLADRIGSDQNQILASQRHSASFALLADR
jgi:predicted Fe-S protein YdhL (DUF1289 family)